METYIVKRLEQAKLLTDPFKLKLIEAFARVPATTKQVADKLGEKAPRLYRHVDALVDEGLLVLVKERPKRGTIERYYKTVADRFEVDPQLFSPTSGVGDDAVELMRALFRDTESDLVRVFAGLDEGAADREELPLVVKFGMRGTPEEIAAMRAKLEAWIEECNSHCGDDEDIERSESYAGLLTLYRRPSDQSD